MNNKINSLKVKSLPSVLLLIFILAYILSAIKPFDYFYWFYDSLLPVGIVLILAVTYKIFRFSTITYVVTLIQCIFILIGSHFTYHRIPFMSITFSDGTERGIFDWVAHFTAAFMLSLMAFEILKYQLKITSVKFILIASIFFCLGIAAIWELIEWLAWLVSNNAFDLTQGYEWDTQMDIFMTLNGSVFCMPFLVIFSNKHGD